jgi:hypothetical protein
VTGVGGPYVQIAAICETFIKGEQSHALSLINIVEGWSGAGPESEMPSAHIGAPLKLVINLWAGQARGRYSLKLRQEAPSGIQDDPIDIAEVQFNELTGLGVDTILQMPEYDFTEQGTYWFDVLLGDPGDGDGELLTRIPFSISYRQTVTIRRPR